MSEQQAEEIRIDMEEAEQKVARADALERLYNNPDFKKLILDEYFKDHAAGLVRMKAFPNWQNESQQRLLDNAIMAVAEIQQYFQGIFQQAGMAQEAIQQAELELEAMAEEGSL